MARESAENMRHALSDQLRALEQLSSLSARERRDVTPPGSHAGQPLPCRSPRPSRRSARTSSCPWRSTPRDRWSLGDLLARASREDSAINIASIARALDPTTASAIWSRFRAGQRGIMVRSIYTNDGRALFDEISARYKTDVDFRRVVDRFLVDFEWLIRDIEQKDPAGRARAQSPHLRQRPGVSVPCARERAAALTACAAFRMPPPLQIECWLSRPGRSRASSPLRAAPSGKPTVVVAQVSDGERQGPRGVCAVRTLWRDRRSVRAAILAQRDAHDRSALLQQMPAGAARNALDCALWDYEAKRSGTSVAALAGLHRLDAVTTAYTISLADRRTHGRQGGRSGARRCRC